MAAKRVEGIHIERAADEILAVKTATSEAHALNQSAAVIFDLCDGTVSKYEMAARLQRRTGLPADEQIIDLALAELVDAGLITLDDPGATCHRYAALPHPAFRALGGCSCNASHCRDNPCAPRKRTRFTSRSRLFIRAGVPHTNAST